MSRKIKYRVWDNENKSYNDPYSHSYYAMTQDGKLDFYCHGDHWDSCDPDVYFIEQYTGLKDKNGKEIYEGDIFQNDYDGGYDVVKWVERHAGFMLCYMGDEDESESLSLYKMDELEIIGNIHENPELIGGEE